MKPVALMMRAAATLAILFVVEGGQSHILAGGARAAAGSQSGPRAAPPLFVCPMHSDVRGPKPGTCSRCGMSLVPIPVETPLAYVLDADTMGAPLDAGKAGRLRLSARHPVSHDLVRRFTAVHEKLFHLFVVSHDLSYFDHVHPIHQDDGAFEIALTLPRRGAYQLYADFLPDGGTPQLLQRSLFTRGFAADPEDGRARLRVDVADKIDRKLAVRLELPGGSGLIAGRQEMFRVRVAEAATKAPVTDLEPFLGAAAHGLIISENLRDALHIHPVAEFSRPNGPDIVFQAVFPRAGLYKLWAQFQRHGEVAVVHFVLPVSETP
jgi:hypothetical protein